MAMPRENYSLILEAIELAKKVGLDSPNDIEALSMICAEFLSTWLPDVERAKPHKFEGILRRDNYTCQECQKRTQLSVHHIQPKSLGGTDSPFNLITLCIPCHDMIQKEAMKWHGNLVVRARENTRRYALESAERDKADNFDNGESC